MGAREKCDYHRGMFAPLLGSIALLAQSAGRTSFLGWALQSMGILYGFLIPFSAFVVFVGACIVVFAFRRPSVIASYLVFLPLPALIGAFGTVHGLISSYAVIANSTSVPMQSEIAQGYSMSLFTLCVGLLFTFPSYFVLAIGLFVRAVMWRGEQNSAAAVANSAHLPMK